VLFKPDLGGRVAHFNIAISDDVVEAIAARAAEIVLEQIGRESTSPVSPYLSVGEAAEYARCSRQRIYDLLSSGRLTRHKDGSRVLVERAELDRYLAGDGRNGVAPVLPPGRRSRMNRSVSG
jgi:excisionase family DNA binding protein